MGRSFIGHYWSSYLNVVRKAVPKRALLFHVTGNRCGMGMRGAMGQLLDTNVYHQVIIASERVRSFFDLISKEN